MGNLKFGLLVWNVLLSTSMLVVAFVPRPSSLFVDSLNNSNNCECSHSTPTSRQMRPTATGIIRIKAGPTTNENTAEIGCRRLALPQYNNADNCNNIFIPDKKESIYRSKTTDITINTVKSIIFSMMLIFAIPSLPNYPLNIADSSTSTRPSNTAIFNTMTAYALESPMLSSSVAVATTTPESLIPRTTNQQIDLSALQPATADRPQIMIPSPSTTDTTTGGGIRGPNAMGIGGPNAMGFGQMQTAQQSQPIVQGSMYLSNPNSNILQEKLYQSYVNNDILVITVRDISNPKEILAAAKIPISYRLQSKLLSASLSFRMFDANILPNKKEALYKIKDSNDLLVKVNTCSPQQISSSSNSDNSGGSSGLLSSSSSSSSKKKDLLLCDENDLESDSATSSLQAEGIAKLLPKLPGMVEGQTPLRAAVSLRLD